MLHRVILACEMIEDEVGLAMEALPADARPPIVWVESGLHDHPERLNAALQDLVDRLDEGSRSGEAVDLPSVAPGSGPRGRAPGDGLRGTGLGGALGLGLLWQGSAGVGLP